MPAGIRIQPLDRTQLIRPGGPLSPEAAARMVADAHRAAVAEAVALDTRAMGRPPEATTFVNGAVSVDLDQVRPGQSIVTVFNLANDLLQWIYDMLILAAPYLTGRFKRSIAIYADGEPVEDPAAATGAAEIVFTSTVPYARKIERGESSQAPDGVFEAVAALAQRRFGNQARIRFGYQVPIGGESDLERWARRHAARNGRNRPQDRVRDRRQPAIVVSLR